MESIILFWLVMTLILLAYYSRVIFGLKVKQINARVHRIYTHKGYYVGRVSVFGFGDERVIAYAIGNRSFTAKNTDNAISFVRGTVAANFEFVLWHYSAQPKTPTYDERDFCRF